MYTKLQTSPSRWKNQSEESLDRFPFIISLFHLSPSFQNGFWNEEAERKRKPFVAMLEDPPSGDFRFKLHHTYVHVYCTGRPFVPDAFINQSQQPLFLYRCRHCFLSTRRAQSYQKSDSRSTQMNLLIVSLSSSFFSSPFASVSKMDKTSYDQ